jgi:hypothetical protein
MNDFTLNAYKQLLLALKEAGYAFYTFEDWCRGKASGKFVILRHDVDLKSQHSLFVAEIERELQISSSYYFRIIPQSNDPKVIQKVVELGHEIGYHYEDLALSKGNIPKGIASFERHLNYFKQFYPVSTICMHGSPTSKYDNRKLWDVTDYRDYGIIGEPYFDFLNNKTNQKVRYFTDTARMWDGDKYNVRDKGTGSNVLENKNIHSTFDLIHWIKNTKNQLPVMITTHPQRWTNNRMEWYREFYFQSLKNRIKYFLIKMK